MKNIQLHNNTAIYIRKTIHLRKLLLCN